eukprot:12706536-Alexandrium_andersonii.AAC.1
MDAVANMPMAGVSAGRRRGSPPDGDGRHGLNRWPHRFRSVSGPSQHARSPSSPARLLCRTRDGWKAARV